MNVIQEALMDFVAERSATSLDYEIVGYVRGRHRCLGVKVADYLSYESFLFNFGGYVQKELVYREIDFGMNYDVEFDLYTRTVFFPRIPFEATSVAIRAEEED